MALPAESAAVYLEWVARIASVGIVVRTLEVLANWPALKDGELLGWGGLATSRFTLLRFLQRLQGYPFCALGLFVRVLGAVSVFFLSYGTLGMMVALALLVLTQLYYNHRFEMLSYAAEHLRLTSLCALLFGALPGASERFRCLCLGFIAFQVALAYVGTAKSKLCSSYWRDGTRIIQIFQESAHRFPPLGRFFGAYPRVALLATWAVILLQLIFPVSLLLPPPAFAAVLAGGVLFHGTLAFTMGLHGFFWAFVATYPALYFFHARLAEMLYRG